MEKVSLVLIVIGLVIIAVVLISRLRLRRRNESTSEPYRRASAQDDMFRDEPPEYDPLFAIDNAEAEQRELDKWGAIHTKDKDEPVVEIPPPAPPAHATTPPPPQSAPRVKTPATPPQPAPRVTTHAAPPVPPPAPVRSPPRLADVAEQVITLNVIAPEGHRFAGPAIAAAMARAGLEWGAWSIYHYYSHQDPHAPPLFSVANMVKPGNFDPQRMDEISTVGLSLFMVPAMDGTDLASLDILLATARQLAGDLGGELRDSRRSVLTRQAIELLREQINEWRRKAQVAHS